MDKIKNITILPSLFRFISVISELGSRFKWQSLYFLIIIASCILYIITYVNIPISIYSTASHDDGLFINQARNLALGKWLGDYNQMTLAKGPGYPLFLAIGYWIGLSVSFMHALVHCFSTSLMAWVINKLTGLRLLSLAVFIGTLWHPAFYFVGRVIRDPLYSDQTLIVVACFFYILFSIGNQKKIIYWSMATGIIFGWCWLTREEGVWLLPGIGFLVLFAVVQTSQEKKSLNRVLIPVSTVFIMFLFVQLLFQTVNWFVYDDFVGVDIKEKNYKAAISALFSVQADDPIPYLPVPRSTREQLYSVSPAFSLLKSHFDPPGGGPWSQAGCASYPATCGDIAAGWFIWALRDAVALQGFYNSPENASRYYQSLVEEINNACEEGKLRCKKSVYSLMPNINKQQYSLIPEKVTQLFRYLAYENGLYSGTGPSWGPKATLSSALELLNHPLHYPIQAPEKIKLKGWYYEIGNKWFNYEVDSSNNSMPSIVLERHNSQDIARNFNDKKAMYQRFVLTTDCKLNCTIIFSNDQGEIQHVEMSSIINDFENNQTFDIGKGRLQLDSMEKLYTYDPLVSRSKSIISNKVRYGLNKIYKLIKPILFYVGLVSFIICLILAWKMSSYPILLVFSTVSWILIITRAVILILIDLTSFPAINIHYVLPLFDLAVIAIVSSIGAIYIMAKKMITVSDIN